MSVQQVWFITGAGPGMGVDQQQPPRRFIALPAIVELAEHEAETLKAQAGAFRDLSSSLAHDNA